MDKAFFKELCEDYDYRFFTGIPFKDFKNFYANMNPDLMHYIPAANELIALRLAAGSWLSGIKSAVVLEPSKVDKLDFSFNIKLNIPILVLTSDNGTPIQKGLYNNTDLSKVVAYIERNSKPAVLLL
jgi:sulfopyruvate decarboxylase TPP-binding subunit